MAVIANYPVSFGSRARVFANRIHQVCCSAVVQQEDALPEAPQWRGAELVGTRTALRHPIRADLLDVEHLPS